MAQTIMYYPTIDIQDGAWLRNALLYWDSISSIVPYENYPNFSPELLYLQNCGIYKPFFPQVLFASEYAQDFTKTTIAKLERYKKRTKTSKQRSSSHTTTRMHRNKIYAPALYELVHCRKASPDLLRYLSDNGFIHDYHCGGWMTIDAPVASIYMRTFAEYAIKCLSEDTVIGTDQLKHQNQFYAPSRPTKNTTCISLALNNCLPQPAMDVGYEELLDFKDNHKKELAEFRKKLRDFEKVLSMCERAEEIKFETEKFKEDWQSTLLKENRMFINKKIPFTLGTMYTLINVPSIAEPLDNAIKNICPIIDSKAFLSSALLGGTAAITLGYEYISYKNKINEQRSSSGFSYIIKASQSGIITPL